MAPINVASNKELEQQLYNQYVFELREAKKNKNEPLPLHLYSKRVYRAYHNEWRFIDRKLLTSEEISIMLKLGIYKPSQTQLGIRHLTGDEKGKMTKMRLKLVSVQP